MIVPTNYDRHLVYISDQGKQVAFKIVGFDVDDKGVVRPITYPTPPKSARCFASEPEGFRSFDLASGIISGPASIKPE